jgi:hypothetical protein
MPTCGRKEVNHLHLVERPGLGFSAPGATERTYGAMVRSRCFAVGSKPYQSSGGGAAMSGEEWPKESQRMCNGASGQVPVTSIDGDTFELPANLRAEADIAIDVADHMAAQSLDYAVMAVTSGKACGVRGADIVRLADAHLACATGVFVARLHAETARDVGIENAGAISEAGTDIGAGIALALEQALKTFPNDNTHNDLPDTGGTGVHPRQPAPR